MGVRISPRTQEKAMAHFPVLVLADMENVLDLESYVANQLAPYNLYKYINKINPLAKWAWYQIGGRWSRRSMPSKAFDILELAPKAALVTPDRAWFEREDDYWTKEALDILDEHVNFHVIVVDCYMPDGQVPERKRP